jgi:hypothetical protein
MSTVQLLRLNVCVSTIFFSSCPCLFDNFIYKHTRITLLLTWAVVFFIETNKQHVIIIKMSASESHDSVEEQNPFMDLRKDGDCHDFVALQKGAIEFREYLDQLSSQQPSALENCPFKDRIIEPLCMPDQTDDKEKIELKLKIANFEKKTITKI